MGVEHWYFTFGSDHLDGKGMNKYVEVKGNVTYTSAREIMWALFSNKWAFQYDEDSFMKTRAKMTCHMTITVEECE